MSKNFLRIQNGFCPKSHFSDGAFWLIIILAALIFPYAARAQDSSSAENIEDRKQSLQSQIDALEKEAAEIDKNIDATRKDAESLKNEIAIFNGEIRKRELEIKKMNLAVKQAEIDIEKKDKNINEVEKDIGNKKGLLASSVLMLNDYENEGFLYILMKNKSVSSFLLAVDNIFSIQKTVKSLIIDLREKNRELATEKDELEEFKDAQGKLKSLQEVEKRFLSQKKSERDKILSLTKGKEILYQKILQQKKKDIAALRTSLFYLEKTGITAEDALKYAELAAKRTGIRTAFLLAILEVETGKQFEDGVISVGTNLGTGNWKRDMYDCYIRLGKRSAAESQKNAFFEITDKLGLDPNKMPVSRRPSYGCGGAMGPAQFIPTTWLLFEKKVAALTGHNPPSPWNIEDAFTASAVFLAGSGADLQTKNGELRAARTYISGRSTCSTKTSSGRACNYYANRVYSLSQEIDRVI